MFEEHLQSETDDPFLNNMRIIDVRHGKVLLLCTQGRILAVWDPMNGETTFTQEPENGTNSQASILCAANHDHKDGCNNCPIKIIWISTGRNPTKVYTFCSATAEWKCAVCVLPSLSYVKFRPGTIVGNVMYSILSVNHLFSFNMIDSSMSYIEQPHEVDTILRRNVHVMKIRNHELGVAAVINFEMRIWRMEADLDETICWIPHKVIQLQPIISFPRTTHLCWKPKAILLHVFEDR